MRLPSSARRVTTRTSRLRHPQVRLSEGRSYGVADASVDISNADEAIDLDGAPTADANLGESTGYASRYLRTILAKPSGSVWSATCC